MKMTPKLAAALVLGVCLSLVGCSDLQSPTEPVIDPIELRPSYSGYAVASGREVKTCGLGEPDPLHPGDCG